MAAMKKAELEEKKPWPLSLGRNHCNKSISFLLFLQ